LKINIHYRLAVEIVKEAERFSTSFGDEALGLLSIYASNIFSN